MYTVSSETLQDNLSCRTYIERAENSIIVRSEAEARTTRPDSVPNNEFTLSFVIDPFTNDDTLTDLVATHSDQFLDAFRAVTPTTTAAKWENVETTLTTLADEDLDYWLTLEANAGRDAASRIDDKRMNSLTLENLPALPQSVRLGRLAQRLWEQEEVVALWIGGSIAGGIADEYSDVDLRVAVRPEMLERWGRPDLAALFENEIVGENMSLFGADAVLHHLVLSNGVIFDFWVQSTDRDPAPEHILILGCRDEEYRRRLEDTTPLPTCDFPLAESDTVRQVIVDFWINSLKHSKVLHRKLDLLAAIGVGMERAVLLRLWHVETTGRDNGAARLTIHSLTKTIRALEYDLDPQRWRLQGAALTTRAEIIAAIETNRDDVSRVGQALAAALGFSYPASLEQTVRWSWAASLGSPLAASQAGQTEGALS